MKHSAFTHKKLAPGQWSGLASPHDGNITGLLSWWGYSLLHWAGKPLAKGWKLAFRLVGSTSSKVLKRSGINDLIIRYKVAFIAVVKYLGGEPLTCTEQLGVRIRMRHGLPLLLPKVIRAAVRQGSPVVIRVVLSLLYSYKGFQGVYGKATFETITSPMPTLNPSLYKEFCDFIPKWMKANGWKRILPSQLKTELGDWPIIVTAGANSSVSFAGAAIDAATWNAQPVNHAKAWFKIVQPEVNVLLDRLAERSKYDPASHSLGRLSLREEAAGKIRVFAICDYWTQVALKPFHRILFDGLKGMTTDGTFDQEGAVKSFAALGHTDVYSYDLKAATDLIPRPLYDPILKYLLGDQLAGVWTSLLTDRSFSLPTGYEGEPLRYTRGQPMGAYSSWAMLALVHHALYAFAAHRVGLASFTDYRVLGDDGVVAGSRVAASYLAVCDQFAVIVGLAKSFESRKGLFNFASQVLLREIDLSPASLKEYLRGPRNSRILSELGHRLYRRGWCDATASAFLRFLVPPKDWISFRGVLTDKGETPLSRRVSRTLLWPWSPLARALTASESQLFRAFLAAATRQVGLLAGGNCNHIRLLPHEDALIQSWIASERRDLEKDKEHIKAVALKNLAGWSLLKGTREDTRLDISPLLGVLDYNFTAVNKAYVKACDGYRGALDQIRALENWRGLEHQVRNLLRLMEAKEELAAAPLMDTAEAILNLRESQKTRSSSAILRLALRLEKAHKTFKVNVFDELSLPDS